MANNEVDSNCGHAGRVTLPNAGDGILLGTGDGGHAGRVTLPERKRINHRGPLSIDMSYAWYFITLCAEGHRPWVGSCAHLSPCTVGSRVPRDREGEKLQLAHPVGSRVPRDRILRPMSFPTIAETILSAARWYHEHGKWQLSLFLVMPDHLHFIARFPAGDGGHAGRVTLPNAGDGILLGTGDGGHAGRVTLPNADDGILLGTGDGGHAGRVTLPMTAVIQQFKSYLNRTSGIRFQRDFFDTRIRDDAHCAEKSDYIKGNPVRKGFCASPSDWAYSIVFSRETGEVLSESV